MIPEESEMVRLGRPKEVYDHMFTPFIQRNAPSSSILENDARTETRTGGNGSQLLQENEASGTTPDFETSSTFGDDQGDVDSSPIRSKGKQPAQRPK